MSNKTSEVPGVDANDKSSEDLALSDSSEPQCAYLLSEANIFNNRIIWYLEQQQKQEIFALGSSGALWAYLLKGNGELFSYMVAFVAPVITAALYVKSMIMTKAMGETMDYLKKIEDTFKLTNQLGWIHYYKMNTSNYKRRWREYFWKGLLIANICVCALFIYFHSKSTPITDKPDSTIMKIENVEIGRISLAKKHLKNTYQCQKSH